MLPRASMARARNPRRTYSAITCLFRTIEGSRMLKHKITLLSIIVFHSCIGLASGSFTGTPAPQHNTVPQNTTVPVPSNTQSYPANSISPTPYNASQYNSPQNLNTPNVNNLGQRTGTQQASSDQFYELGKYIYTGKSKKIGKFRYCIDTGKGKTLIKKTNLKQFRGQSFSNIADKLYDCDSPNIQVSNYMKDKHLTLVVYYLNQRYQMGLIP